MADQYNHPRKELEEEFQPLIKEYGWSPKEYEVFIDLLIVYRQLREQGPKRYITRKMLSKSAGLASKYLRVIEVVEGDQPRRTRTASEKPPEQASSPHPANVETAIEAVLKAMGGLSSVFSETRTKDRLEEAERYQLVLREQQKAADDRYEAEQGANQERIDDLLDASSGAGDESWKAREEIEQLRDELVVTKMELVTANGSAEQAAQALKLAQVQLASVEVQVEVLKGSSATQSTELSRLRAECQRLEEVTAQFPEVHAENIALHERAAGLAEQVGRLEELISDIGRRHDAERVAIRAEYDLALAEEHQRSDAREAALVEVLGTQMRGVGENA